MWASITKSANNMNSLWNIGTPESTHPTTCHETKNPPPSSYYLTTQHCCNKPNAITTAFAFPVSTIRTTSIIYFVCCHQFGDGSYLSPITNMVSLSLLCSPFISTKITNLGTTPTLLFKNTTASFTSTIMPSPNLSCITPPICKTITTNISNLKQAPQLPQLVLALSSPKFEQLAFSHHAAAQSLHHTTNLITYSLNPNYQRTMTIAQLPLLNPYNRAKVK